MGKGGAISDGVLKKIILSYAYVAVWIFLSFTVIMLKALMPVAVYSIGILFKKDAYKPSTMANMISISIGVAIAAYGEANLNPITSLYYVAPSCLLFLSIPWLLVEFPVLRRSSGFRFDFTVFGTNSLCAFALNLAVFLLVGKTSALTMNVAGVVKDWLLIAFSWSVIKDTVTPINLLGYGLAFLGVAFYNHSKLQALKAKEAQKKTQQQTDEESGKLLGESGGDSLGKKGDAQA
nr:probable sugar phosphate/phosphate translocator At2g25520 [Ipomoea batatas]